MLQTKAHRELVGTPPQNTLSHSNSVVQQPSIFFCQQLLKVGKLIFNRILIFWKVDPKKGYAVFFVAPGGVSYLVKERSNMYRFHTIDKMHDKVALLNFFFELFFFFLTCCHLE